MKTHTQHLNFERAPAENLNFLSYIKLLNGVSTRINTSLPEQINIPCNGLIDKLEFEVCATLEQSQLYENIRKLKLNSVRTRLNNRHWYEKVFETESTWGIYFKPHFTVHSILEIVSNPSQFKNLYEYTTTLKSLIFPLTLNDLKIKRMDLTCDYEIPFSSFIQCLDVQNKRKKTTHTGMKVTGIYFGQKPNIILAYDKSEQLKQKEQSVSRLELSLTGKALPFRDAKTMSDPKKVISLISNYNPFSEVNLFEVTVGDKSILTNEFKILLKTQGFQAARQILNKYKNFRRDIEPHLTKKLFTKQPSDALIEGLQRFCCGGEREQSNHLRTCIF